MWLHRPACAGGQCYCADPDVPDPVCDCGCPAWACECSGGRERDSETDERVRYDETLIRDRLESHGVEVAGCRLYRDRVPDAVTSVRVTFRRDPDIIELTVRRHMSEEEACNAIVSEILRMCANSRTP